MNLRKKILAFFIALTGIFSVNDSSAATVESSKTETTFESRVIKLRESIKENKAISFGISKDKGNTEMGASWPNWGNWGNWGNWNNWSKWNDWVNWGKSWGDWINW